MTQVLEYYENPFDPFFTHRANGLVDLQYKKVGNLHRFQFLIDTRFTLACMAYSNSSDDQCSVSLFYMVRQATWEFLFVKTEFHCSIVLLNCYYITMYITMYHVHLCCFSSLRGVKLTEKVGTHNGDSVLLLLGRFLVRTPVEVFRCFPQLTRQMLNGSLSQPIPSHVPISFIKSFVKVHGG